MIPVLNLCLGKGRLAIDTPVYRFFAPDQAAVQGEFAKFPDNGGFIGVVHGEIRSLPFAKYSQAFELLSLNVNIFFSVTPAVLSDFHLTHLRLLGSKLFVHLMLYGQTVTIPTRHVRGIKASHLFGFYYYILEYFIERCTHMNVAICIRRAIMEHVLVPAFCDFTNLMV